MRRAIASPMRVLRMSGLSLLPRILAHIWITSLSRSVLEKTRLVLLSRSVVLESCRRR